MNENGICYQDEYYDDNYRYSTSKPNNIYVNEIQRTCQLDGEDYYDPTTKCWFWFNNEISLPQWQYWYEGISSDYGDYGWMEYDDVENKWYIEVSDGKWELLSDKYDTSRLWHFDSANINTLF